MKSSPYVEELISVVIPTVGFDHYLEVAVKSVLEDNSGNVEVVVVLDGAAESTPAWIDMNPEIRVLATGERKGAGAALNLGISAAKGEYIARLDSDDISMPGRFGAQLRAFRENPNAVLIGSMAQLIDQNGTIRGMFYSAPSADLHQRLLTGNPFVHSSIMVRKSALVAAEGYDESCIRMQDYELILRLALHGELIILPHVFVKYRVHEGQSSKKLSGFSKLMLKISCRRMYLAKYLGQPTLRQLMLNALFIMAQLVRYIGLRKPRYLLGAKD